jgi:anion-transporting  ArsA/GET3 family ATPase
LLVEIDNFHPSTTAIFNRKPSYEPQQLNGNLYFCNITWLEALQDWLYKTIPIRRIVKLIKQNKVALLFLDATPGAREIVILSKIVELAEKFDRVIVDLPASGHALGILRVPKTAMQLMPSGPIYERANHILSVFSKHDTQLVLVSLPEEMVVNETLEFQEKIKNQIPEIGSPDIVLNRIASPSFSTEETLLLDRLSELSTTPEMNSLLEAGRWEQTLEKATSEAVLRLNHALGHPPIVFPRFGVLGGFDGGPSKVVSQLTKAIRRASIKKVPS